MKLFGTSGIRGIANEEFFHLTLNVGLAVGQHYRRVIVGSDTRNSSPAMKQAFISGLLAAGASAYDAGVIPTPTLALAARSFDAGAVITASHNPPEYNGIKLWNPDGCAFDYQQRQQIEEIIAGGSFCTAPWQEIKSSSPYSQAIEQHIERILLDFPSRFELKVVIDCGCGAASVITPHLLRRLGCTVVSLNCYPSGSFPRPSEPTESSLGDLMKATRELGADLGIAHDGDADRMMLVDGNGKFISGDKLLVLFARALQARSIVTTIDASMVVEEMGFAVTRTHVGDSHVSTELRERGDFGGEPSGSWIFPSISLCPDGIYAAALAVKIASKQQLSSLVNSLPCYPVLRGSIPSSDAIMSRLQARLLAMEPTAVSEVDGIKLSFHDGWLLVRASGTEPKIRLTVEAKTEARTHQLFDQAAATIKECTG